MVPPAKGCKFVERKRKEKKRKEKRGEGRKQKTTHLERKGTGEKVTEKTAANFGGGETKFASYDVSQNNKLP